MTVTVTAAEHEHDSPIHGWDPRYKLTGLFTLVLAFSFLSDLRLICPMLVVSLVTFAGSKLPVSLLLSRLRAPAPFLIVLAVILPLTAGDTVVAQIGPLAIRQEGCLRFMLIASKLTAIVTIVTVLFDTTPVNSLIRAMRAIGIPRILADMIMFSHRFLFQFSDDLAAMRTGMRLRGFRARSVTDIAGLSALAGTLLVRSFERADTVYGALRLRGFGAACATEDEWEPRLADAYGLAVTLLITGLFIAGEVIL